MRDGGCGKCGGHLIRLRRSGRRRAGRDSFVGTFNLGLALGSEGTREEEREREVRGDAATRCAERRRRQDHHTERERGDSIFWKHTASSPSCPSFICVRTSTLSLAGHILGVNQNCFFVSCLLYISHTHARAPFSLFCIAVPFSSGVRLLLSLDPVS